MDPVLKIAKCPKCGHRHDPSGTDAPGRCASCGLYFEKWAMRDIAPVRSRADGEPAGQGGMFAALRQELSQRLLHIPGQAGMAWIGGRAALLAFLLFWSLRLAAMDYRDGEMGSSFMHAILLPIHEAGHVLFIPFGQFMTVLGGSLFQLLLPMIVAGALLWQNRDGTGAATGLWWCGASLLDLSAYIYDAKHPQLILLGGHTGEDGPHDWIYLLGVFNRIEQAQRYGAIAHKLGVALMLLAIAGAAVLLWRIAKARRA